MILRKEKHDNKYTVIDNKVLQDNSISWKAKGVLSYLLSLPDDWKIYLEELTEHTTDGITATRSAVQELINAGYITRNQLKDDKGRFDNYEYVVHETKKEPKLGFPISDELISDNLTLQSTDNTKYPLNKDIVVVDSENENFEIAEIAKAYESEIGIITPFIREDIIEAAKTYPKEWIIEAIKISSANHVPKWSYVEGILKSWKAHGYKVDTRPKRNGSKARRKQANPNLSNFSGIWNSQSRDAKIRLLKDMKARGILEPGDELEAIEVGLLEEENE